MTSSSRSRALRRALLAGAAVTVLALQGPAAAAAAPVGAVALAYQRAGGRLAPCAFSAATLAAALRAQAPDQAEYDENFTLAIQAALNAQAAGACAHHGTAATGTTTSGAAAPAGSAPTSITAPTSAGPPAPLIALGLAVLLLALAALAFTLLRLSGWDSLWLADWRQACGEAGYRLSLTRGDLADRLARRRAPGAGLSSRRR